MENILAGGEYFKDCFTALGLPEGKVSYIWASSFVDDSNYWERVVRVLKSSSLRRILRAMPVMGRTSDSGDVEAAWTLYPAMQASDIFHMELDAACSGIDQRKVHMLARELASKLSFKIPVCLHSPLLPGLQTSTIEGTFDENVAIDSSIKQKMSKSIEGGAIWVNDPPKVIREKYRRAFCPDKMVEGNPILDHIRKIVFPQLGVLEIERPSKYGGDIIVESFEELESLYRSGELHPLDMKNAVADAIIKLLEPVRTFFVGKPDNLEKMQKLQLTR
jgi:tyrosyl-tRNA synthetase